MRSASPRLRALALHAAILGVFLLAAIAMTWPLALHLDRAISDPGDPFFTTFTIAWDWHALTHGLRLFDAPLFYPDRHALAFSEHMAGLMLVLAPLFAIGLAPLTIHNLGLLLAFVANAWCMFLLARYATRSTLAALVAGVAFAFLGFRFQHLPHLHFLWSGWLPLALLFLLKFTSAPTRRNALAFGAVLVLNGLSSLHWLVLGTMAIGVTLLFLLVSDAELLTPELYRRLAITGGGVVLVLVPFTIPYFQVTREYGMERLYEETIQNSAEWSDWLVPAPQSRAYAGRASIAAQECAFFPGFVILTLAAIAVAAEVRFSKERRGDWLLALLAIAGLAVFLIGALFAPGLRAIGACVAALAVALSLWLRFENRSRAVACALLWLALGALGARGIRGFLGTVLFEHVPAFRGIRVPARWVMIADVGLCLLAAYGAAALLRRFRGVPRLAVATLLCAALLIELRVAPIRWYLVPLEERPVYAWLEQQPISGGVLELPLTQDAAYEYLWRATAHHRPLLNGVSSYTPPRYRELEALLAEPELPPSLLPALIARRCSLIIVHEGALRERGTAVRAWLRRELDAGGLTFLGRFDAGTRPDWLFAVNAIERASSTWRAAEQRDPAGRTPTENLALFLDRGDWTYNSQPFLSVDTPVVGTIRGPLTVSGWALAPEGVSQVVLHFANGRVSVPAELTDRQDVQALLPWYPKTRHAGFRITLDRPPKGIRGATDLQFEIVDGAGKRRRNPPIWFHWRRELRDKPVWKRAPLQELLARIEAPSWSLARLESGVSAIQDFCAPLVSHRAHESDYQFVERTLSTLLGPLVPSMRSYYLELLGRGIPRDRIIEQILTSDEFRARYLVSGRVTIDQRITTDP